MIPKLKTAQEEEKKEKRSKLLMTIFVVVILGASTAGYALMETSSSESKKYNGTTFIKTTSGWQPKKMNFVTTYLPGDVENISVSGDLSIDNFANNAYLVASGEGQFSAANELLKVLPLKKATLSCLPENENESFCKDLPLKNCEDASTENPIIIFSDANETSVSYSDYCLKIEGKDEGFIMAADKTIFVLYGIMSN
jgi:hypothetical protein